MQYSFEFDAPRYCSFANLDHIRISSDYTLHDSDQNDFWFMHTHEKPSPQTLSCPPIFNNQSLPVVRTHINIQVEPLIQLSENQGKNAEKQGNSQQENDQKIKFEVNPNQRLIKNNPFSKKNKLAMRKTAVEKPKANVLKHHSVDKQEKPVNIFKTTLRSKTYMQKTNLKDIRPCPFPPRIQRQWEQKYEKKWYSLSPPSKAQAQRFMKQIQQQKQNKDQSKDKSNIPKNEPARKQPNRKKG